MRTPLSQCVSCIAPTRVPPSRWWSSRRVRQRTSCLRFSGNATTRIHPTCRNVIRQLRLPPRPTCALVWGCLARASASLRCRLMPTAATRTTTKSCRLGSACCRRTCPAVRRARQDRKPLTDHGTRTTALAAAAGRPSARLEPPARSAIRHTPRRMPKPVAPTATTAPPWAARSAGSATIRVPHWTERQRGSGPPPPQAATASPRCRPAQPASQAKPFRAPRHRCPAAPAKG